MSLTQCGPVCDVGGEYILLENITEFFAEGFRQVLFCCETHLPALRGAASSGRWQDLPEGPLRKAFQEAGRRMEAADASV